MEARYDLPEGRLFTTIDGLKNPQDESLILDKVKQHIHEIKETNGDLNHLNWMRVAGIFSTHRTSMRTAIIRNASKTVKLLLDAKANFDYDPPQYRDDYTKERCNMFPETYLLSAVEYKSTECVEVLLEKYRELGVLEKLINQPPKYNSQMTCVHTAASKGDVRTLRVLLEAKANVNTKDYLGRNPLQTATLEYFEYHRNPHYLQCMELLSKTNISPMVPKVAPLEYKNANQKQTKWISEKLNESRLLGCEHSNTKLLKYSSFPIIQDALQEKNPKITFELVRIISEYLDHDIELNSWELFVFNEKKNFFDSLKVSGTLSSMIAFSLLLFLITTPLSLSSCVKGSIVGGLGFFGFVTSREVKSLKDRYNEQKQQHVASLTGTQIKPVMPDRNGEKLRFLKP